MLRAHKSSFFILGGARAHHTCDTSRTGACHGKGSVRLARVLGSLGGPTAHPCRQGVTGHPHGAFQVTRRLVARRTPRAAGSSPESLGCVYGYAAPIPTQRTQAHRHRLGRLGPKSLGHNQARCRPRQPCCCTALPPTRICVQALQAPPALGRMRRQQQE